MMTLNEWELLVAEQEIEIGDTIDIEEGNGDVTPAVFQGLNNRFSIKVVDKNKKVRTFAVGDLYEIKGRGFISGVSKTQLSLKTLI